MTHINLHDLATLSADARRRLLTRTEADLSDFEAKVDAIIAAVRDDGDEALARFAREFDRAPVEAGGIAATPAEFDAAEAALEPEVRAAMEYAAESIRRFHEDQKPEEMWLHEIRPGAFAGERTRAIPSVACYVPRGKGAFPSVALMSTIPARVAGVSRVIVCTPPKHLTQEVLAAVALAEVVVGGGVEGVDCGANPAGALVVVVAVVPVRLEHQLHPAAAQLVQPPGGVRGNRAP